MRLPRACTPRPNDFNADSASVQRSSRLNPGTLGSLWSSAAGWRSSRGASMSMPTSREVLMATVPQSPEWLRLKCTGWPGRNGFPAGDMWICTSCGRCPNISASSTRSAARAARNRLRVAICPILLLRSRSSADSNSAHLDPLAPTGNPKHETSFRESRRTMEFLKALSASEGVWRKCCIGGIQHDKLSTVV